MRESHKSRCQMAVIWLIIIAVCVATFILATESLSTLLENSKSIQLEQTPTTVKDMTPTGELFLNSSIQEDYILSNDPDVQNILTTFKVNLGQNIIGSSKLGEQRDCSEEHLAQLRQTIALNNILGKYAENLELKQVVSLCEKENERRQNEKNKIFVITLSEKCSYYIDFSDKMNAPDISALGDNSLKIDYNTALMKVKCQPQKIQFLSNVEEFWANDVDDRAMDQIKERLESRIVTRFTENYREQALEHAANAFKSLFCAMKYETIVINGTSHLCQTH